MSNSAAARAVTESHDDVLPLSAFQRRVLSIPEAIDIFLGGGRGGSKSYTLAVLALRHAEQYGAKARMLYLRRSHQGCADFEALCLDLYTRIYGRVLRFNGHEGLFRFPNGATLEVNQMETSAEYAKMHGRSFTLLLLDEAGQYATPDLLDRLRSNLRGPSGIPIRCVLAANPGDVGHQWIAKRYVFKTKPWESFHEEKSQRLFVYAPSTFLDNPFIDQEAYRRQLAASCPSDPELLRAWLVGDWTIARGSFFGAVIEESRNAVERWPGIPARWGYDTWESYLAHDYGSSAPSVTYIVVRSPGANGPDGKWYPRDSLILVDELASNEPGSLTKGMGWTIPVLADAIKEMCEAWTPKRADEARYQRVRPDGVADDACFAQTGHSHGSISDEFRHAGVHFFPAKKADRLTGWTIMRRLLQDAGKPDVPGLYIARHCEYLWSTLPFLGRDPRRAEDLDSRAADHAADAVRYGCLRQRQQMQKIKLGGI
jgi:hypothetical protein